jgi:hypothetical protein
MPIHDWARVDPNLYHHFHQRWTIAISDALNAGLLPPGFEALIEQHAAGHEPDVLAVVAEPPKTRHTIAVKEDALAARANRVVVRHRLGEVLCVIEIVSPGNKHSRLAFDTFVRKAVEFLKNGVHLSVVDPFPPTPRDPNGVPGAILGELGEAFELTPDKPLTVAAYEAGDPVTGLATTAYVEPVAVGDVLPDLPAYLEWGEHVPVPLESTYQVAWANSPPSMRELVETGRLEGE